MCKYTVIKRTSERKLRLEKFGSDGDEREETGSWWEKSGKGSGSLREKEGGFQKFLGV